jgi:hypothetical protein
MDTTGKPRNYKFNFRKEGFLAWALILPVGLICWAVPFLGIFGFIDNDNTPSWFPIFTFIILGIPAYLVGWIFVYSLMEGIYTKVSFTESWISIRLPWVIFPIIPVIKRIDLERIHRVNLFAAYGSRMAVFLYYFENNKERHFYLPRFKNNPSYSEEIVAIRKRVESLNLYTEEPKSLDSDRLKPQVELPQQKAIQFKGGPIFIQQVVHLLDSFVVLSIVGISAWITSGIPPGGIEAIAIGMVIGMSISLLGFIGIYPIIGQVLIWFFGRWGIGVISDLFFQISPDTIYWDSPESVNPILSQFHLQPIHATFSDFLFWSVLIFSTIISLDMIIGWFRRQGLKRQMGQ